METEDEEEASKNKNSYHCQIIFFVDQFIINRLLSEANAL